jgi:hypothetical protein
LLTFLVYILTIAGGMKSITGIADVSREVLDVIRTTTTASLPLKLKDTGCYRTEFQLPDYESASCDGVQGRQLTINLSISLHATDRLRAVGMHPQTELF